MEARDMENSSIPHFFKNNRLKIGGEEKNKSIRAYNENTNDINNNVQNTKERMQFLFPKLPPKEINNILERSGYNIEKAIVLFKELKCQKNKLNQKSKDKEDQNKPKQLKGNAKRNYNSIIKKESNKNENKPNLSAINNNKQKQNIEPNTSNINLSLNNNNDSNKNSINTTTTNNNSSNTNERSNIISKQKNEINQIQENNLNSNINSVEKNEENSTNNNIFSLDEAKKYLINQQMNYLIGKFMEMTDISQLKKLLKDIGFPESKENKIENDDKNKLVEMLKERIESNNEERKFIINQYNKHQFVCEQIKKKEEKIDELTSSLGNLIDAESQQKMREEEYRTELMEYVKLLSRQNNFNNPREGY